MTSNFFKVNLLDWIDGTIQKVRAGKLWNDAWLSTYFEIGGVNHSCGNKSCPKNASRILYQTGRLKNFGIKRKNYDLQEVWEDSKNGVYALIAIDVLFENGPMEHKQLMERVYGETRSKFNHAPKSDQGAIKLALLLWRSGWVQS